MMNIGMVGVGCISGQYLENFRDTFHEVKLVAVCDLIRERAENAQKNFGVPKIYDTMDEMFLDPEIDIILNLTRPYQHYGVSKAALLAGKHVYCEKPLGINMEEGLELVSIAREKGLMIGGAPDTFLGAGIQSARKLIDDGLIGDVIGGRFAMAGNGIESWHPDPDFYYQPGGGPLFDMGPYYITAMINLMGGVEEVYGYADTNIKTRTITSEPHRGDIIHVNTPTHIEALIKLESGAHASLFTSFEMYGTNQRNIEIYGTKGMLFVPDPNDFSGPLLFSDEHEERTEYPMITEYTGGLRLLGLADMAKALETGRPGRTTYRQTLHVLEVMDSILRSAREDRPIKLTTKFKREAPMDPSLPYGIL